MKPLFRFGSTPETLALFIGVLLGLVSPALGQSACVPPPAGLVSWWQAESNALDLIGSNNGQLQTGAGYALGKAGAAFSFDGVSSKVDLGDPVSLAFTNSFSIEAWVWVNGLPPVAQGHGQILYRGDPRFCLDPYYFSMRVNGSLRFHIEDAQDTLPCGMDLETEPIALQQWKHVAAVFDSETGSMQIYVDGQLAAQTNTAVRPFQTLVNGGTSIGNLSVGQNGQSFNGLIDELSVYGRALTSAEIAAIYGAGSTGKCTGSVGPAIYVQPASETAMVGDNVTFTVAAGGSAPLSYQWQMNGIALNGGTASILSLSNVQLTDAGIYSVVVSNRVGTLMSSNAVLAVSSVCAPAPSGLISWWQAEGNGVDIVSGNNGVLHNNVGFVPGEVGQAFLFNGTNQFVEIPDSPSLDPTNALTLEAWVYVSGNPNTDLATIVTKFSPFDAQQNQYQLETHYAGGRLNFRPLLFLPSGYGLVDGSTTIQFNTWYHVAMTYDGSSLKLYVNGALDGSVAASGSIAPTTQPLRIGGPSSGPWWFNGRVDEVSLYDRALSGAEIQAIYSAGAAGKCAGSFRPMIQTQPSDQTAYVGSTVTFSVVAGGSPPLSYQWEKNGGLLNGATTTILSLTNVQLSDAGSYSVVVTNVAGSITSSPAMLMVSLPPASIQVGAATVAVDGTVIVPVSMVANGNESALGFSLNFDPTLLTNTGVVLGSGASGASLFPNLIHAGTGQLGVAVGLPTGATFAPGTQQVVVVSFASPLVTSATSTPITFGDSPVKRELSDASGIPVSATFSSGTVLLPPSQLEGDAFPRPNGDGALTVSDWVLIGRYVARLDSPTNALEFQKADCAPRSTLGDGALTVSDWVQAGRYVAGLDPAVRAGGPTSEAPQVVAATVPSSVTRRTESNPRQVRLIAPALLQGQTGTVEVDLESQGNENALAFSLSFDPTSLVFVGAAAGNAASGAILNVNAKQAAQGRLGCVLALKANTSFPAGSKQVVNVSFRAATAAGTGLISFGDTPVPREVSDPSASALAADYINAAIVVNSLPALKIVALAKSVSLSWPISATGFVLQESSDSRMEASSWTTVSATPGVVNNESVVSVPASATAKFYRLYHQ